MADRHLVGHPVAPINLMETISADDDRMKGTRTHTPLPKRGHEGGAGGFRALLVCTIGVLTWSAIIAAVI